MSAESLAQALLAWARRSGGGAISPEDATALLQEHVPEVLTECATCGHPYPGHGLVHVRHPQGGGGANVACPANRWAGEGAERSLRAARENAPTMLALTGGQPLVLGRARLSLAAGYLSAGAVDSTCPPQHPEEWQTLLRHALALASVEVEE